MLKRHEITKDSRSLALRFRRVRFDNLAASGVLLSAVGDAGLAEGGEGDGVAAAFGEEVAAEAEHVRPAAQGWVGDLAAHPAACVADVPAGIDETLGVGSG